MDEIKNESAEKRMGNILSQAWNICIQRIASGRIVINKEASLQLHYAYILTQLGELACIGDDEKFKIELESNYKGKNIDITCSTGDCNSAVELKCFMKASSRPLENDMYDVLKDISRLEAYSHVKFRRFICLTDVKRYTMPIPKGHAASVSIEDGKKYQKGIPITPSWSGKWKDKSRDSDIVLQNDLEFTWCNIGAWYYLFMEV